MSLPIPKWWDLAVFSEIYFHGAGRVAVDETGRYGEGELCAAGGKSSRRSHKVISVSTHNRFHTTEAVACCFFVHILGALVVGLGAGKARNDLSVED